MSAHPWPEVALGEVATIERSVRAPEDIETGCRYVGLEDIESGGRGITSHEVEAGQLASAKFEFNDRHILYGKLRPYLAKIALPDFRGVCSTDIVPILPGKHVDRLYLCHLLRQPSMVSYAASRSSGANLPRLAPAELARFQVPLPPIEEQRRIAAVLDQADVLRAKRREARTLLDTLTASIFLEMFGDRRTRSRGFPLVPLESLVDPSHPITRGIDQPGPDVEGGVPYLKTTDFSGRVSRGSLGRAAASIAARFPRSFVREGDSVICIRATVGPVMLINRELSGVNLSRGTARVAPGPGVVPEFLLGALRSKDFQNQIAERLRGATFLQIPLSELKTLIVPSPPSHLQQKYAGRVHATDEVIVGSNASVAALDELFASLQHRAFRGEL